jgi:hypothetical protein
VKEKLEAVKRFMEKEESEANDSSGLK